MQQMYVSLPNVNTVRLFVNALSSLEGDFELVSGNYILDARSLMGIFGLDLSSPVQLNIYKPTQAALDAIAPFAADAAQ